MMSHFSPLSFRWSSPRYRAHSILVIWLLAVGSFAGGQDTASLTGTVRDASGAVVPAATVIVKNIADGTTREVKCNSDGEYVVASVSPGKYNISVTARGFRTFRADGVTLRVAQDARIDVVLRVGDVREEVVVRGEALAQVNTQSSELGGTVTGNQVIQMPLNGRNFTQLITLVPGVSNQTNQDEGVVGAAGNVNYSVNGGRTEYNNWEVDGGDMMDNGSNFSINVYPSVEAIAEVQVLTSNYGAQYGKNGSGTVEVETKSGTNAFHGGAWEFVRNEAFNAHNYFDVAGTPKAGYHKHDFGYKVGGPIWKNHTFFFWLQNWRRETVPYNFYSFVPSLQERQGNFSDMCAPVNPNPTDCPVDLNGNPFPNNQLPSIDPNGQILMNMIPAPNLGSGASSVFAAAVPQPTRWREDLVRLDHDFNSKVRVMFRAIHDSWDTVQAIVQYSGENFPTIGSHYIGPGVEMVGRVSATLSPTLLNEFTASYTTDHLKLINTNPSVWTRTSGFTMTGLFPDFGGKLPDICVYTSGAYGGGFCEGPTAFPWSNSNPTFTYRDNVFKSLGKHKLEFGGYFMNAEKNEFAFTDLGGDLTFDSTVAAVTTGNAFADLLMGNIASYSQASAQPKYHINFKIFEAFLQDDFRVTPRLTLNLGIRTSFFGTFWERNHLISNFDPAAYNSATAPQLDIDGSQTGQIGAVIPGTGNPFDGTVQCGVNHVPRGCLKGHLFNPAPRVGFAWDPLGNGKMSLRGGYGIFFEHTNGMEGNAENLEGTPPIVQTPTEYNVVGYTNIGGQGLFFPQSSTSIPDQVVWPYVQQWNLSVERELIRNTVATLSYVGAKGTHLTLQHEMNELPLTPGSQNPYSPGQFLQSFDCNWGPGSSQPNVVLDAYGVPTNAVTSYGVPVPYFSPSTPGGVPSGPAVNLAVACGDDPDLFRTNFRGLGSLQRVEPVANSNYNAMQFSLRKTEGALTLDVAYTYSHSLDDSSDNQDSNFVNSANIHSNYSSSNYDQRHILSFAWTYDVPFAGKGLAHTFLGGWQYSGILNSQSGTPISVTDGVFGDNAGVADGTTGIGAFADRVGDPFAPAPPVCDYPNTKGHPLFNCLAYQQPQGLTFGNSGRNSLNQPYRTNIDMAVYKVFHPKEKLEAQFRAEAFNVFNHTQWWGVNTYVAPPGTSNFFYPNYAHMERVLQFALRLNF